MTSFPGQHPGPRPRNTKKTLLIIGGILGASVLGCCGLCGLSFFALGKSDVPLRPGDRELVVTAQEVAPWVASTFDTGYGPPYRPRPELAKETLSVSRMGDAELIYEYEDAFITINTDILVEGNERAARDAMAGYSIGRTLAPGLMDEGVELDWVPCDNGLDGADETTCDVMLISDALDPTPFRAGIYLAARVGSRVFVVILGGADFDTPELFSEVLQPKLDALRSWRPPEPP